MNRKITQNNRGFRLSLFALSIILISLIASCDDDENDEPTVLIPAITSVSPDSGEPGDEVTITGTNLESASSVTFGTASATIVSNSSTEIVATVPDDATTGLVSVTTAGGVGVSPSDFTVVIIGAVTVTEVSPMSAEEDETVTITGTDMSTVSAVSIGDVEATVVSTTETTVTITVGTGTTIGEQVFTIVNNGGTTTTSTESLEFYVIKLIDERFAEGFEETDDLEKVNFVGSIDGEEGTIHGKSNDATVLESSVDLPPAIDGVFFHMEGFSSTDFAGSYVSQLSLSTQEAGTFTDFFGSATSDDIYFNVLLNLGDFPDGYADSDEEGDFVVGLRFRFDGDDYEYRTNYKGILALGVEPDENGWLDLSVPATLFDDDASLGTFDFGDMLRYGISARRNYGSGTELPLSAENGGVFYTMSFDNLSISIGGPHSSL